MKKLFFYVFWCTLLAECVLRDETPDTGETTSSDTESETTPLIEDERSTFENDSTQYEYTTPPSTPFPTHLITSSSLAKAVNISDNLIQSKSECSRLTSNPCTVIVSCFVLYLSCRPFAK
jgi:hypothetical protein